MRRLENWIDAIVFITLVVTSYVVTCAAAAAWVSLYRTFLRMLA